MLPTIQTVFHGGKRVESAKGACETIDRMTGCLGGPTFARAVGLGQSVSIGLGQLISRTRVGLL